MWLWKRKHATRRRRKERKDLSWVELGANDARRFVLKTSKNDADFRKAYVLSQVGQQEPSELQRSLQDSMVQEEKLRERWNRLTSNARMVVLEKILASNESLERFGEIELSKYYRKSGKARPGQGNVGKKLPVEQDIPETEGGDEPGGDTGERGESDGFDLTALLQNPFAKAMLAIIAVVLMVKVLRFVGRRLALAHNQGATEATEKLYVVLVHGKLLPVTETQYKEWEAQGRLIPTAAPQPPAAPSSETGTQPEAPPHAL